MEDARDWDLEYDGAAPPLPTKLSKSKSKARRDGKSWAEATRALLPPGAYFLRFDPTLTRSPGASPHKVFAGVLRIHHADSGSYLLTTGSGDLYSTLRTTIEPLAEELGNLDNEEDRLRKLRFPCADYRYYLRLESLWLTAQDQLVLGFDTYRYVDERHGWQRRQTITLRLEAGPPEARPRRGEQQDPRYGPHMVLNSRETPVGKMYLFRASQDLLRSAIVEIHTYMRTGEHSGENTEIHAPDKKEYWDYLKLSGWSVTPTTGAPIEQARDLTPPDGIWTRNHLKNYHKKMIDVDDKDSDAWKYHVLVVERIRVGPKDEPQPRGLMYDEGDNLVRDLPRQGAAIAAMRESEWEGREAPLQDLTDLYHRTVLHELGHMQGLYHDPENRGLMQPLEYLDEDFKEILDMRHSALDSVRLRHLPDLWVRPGGVPFGYRYRATAVDILDLVDESDGLELELEPLEGIAGRGPRRLLLTLKNISQRGFVCPNEEHARPLFGRLSALYETPSGDLEELWPVRPPRPLGGLGNTSLLAGESIEYEIPWDSKRAPLRQAGLYVVHVHLLWTVDFPGESERIFRVSAKSDLKIV